MKSHREMMEELDPERREKINARAQQLIQEELARLKEARERNEKRRGSREETIAELKRGHGENPDSV